MEAAWIATMTTVAWWEHLSMRDVLRLTTTAKALHTGPLWSLFLDWASAHACPCTWHVLKDATRLPASASVTYQRPSNKATFAQMHAVRYVNPAGRTYAPARPTRASTARSLRTKHCRECLCPSTRKAQTKSGRVVLVCKACAMDPTSYSAMCDRRQVLELNGGTRRGLSALLLALKVCKIAGNRAVLYWRVDVEAALAERRDRAMHRPIVAERNFF